MNRHDTFAASKSLGATDAETVSFTESYGPPRMIPFRQGGDAEGHETSDRLGTKNNVAIWNTSARF